MKPKHIQVPDDENYSFRVTAEEIPYFYNPFHYHKSIEISYVLRGYGTRIIGDHIEPFNEGDLVIVGENLPHCWKNDPIFFEPDSKKTVQSIVVQFKPNSMGNLFDLIEFREINQLIKDAKKGIKFYGQTKKIIKNNLKSLSKAKGSKRFLLLIKVLEIMAKTKEKALLNSTFINKIDQENIGRLNAVYEYSIQNIDKKISIDEISTIACLSPNAFCRYFKQNTRKSYTTFLNDLRISKVCQMLLETNSNISEIAYENGFNNLSYFIKTFKRKKGMTPHKYRKQVNFSEF